MIAFHGKDEIKNKYLNRVKKHRELDNLVQGVAWRGGKGCAVGCTLENYNHAQYEVELGIPEWLARVEDTIFEGLTKERAQLWPEQFLSAIKPGIDLEKVKIPFLIFVLESNLESMNKCEFDKEKNPNVVKAIERSRAAVIEMIRFHREGLDLAAEAAVESARSAAEAAARSAESARSAAEAAAWSAASAASAAEAAASARSAAYEKFAEKLLELLEQAR